MALGVVWAWLVFLALDLDVMLGIGRGEAVGWVTLGRRHLGFRGFYARVPAGWASVRFVSAEPAGAAEPRLFALVTADAAERMERLQAERVEWHEPLLNAHAPPPDGRAEVASLPVAPRGRLYGRLRFAGLFRQVVYAFDELDSLR